MRSAFLPCWPLSPACALPRLSLCPRSHRLLLLLYPHLLPLGVFSRLSLCLRSSCLFAFLFGYVICVRTGKCTSTKRSSRRMRMKLTALQKREYKEDYGQESRSRYRVYLYVCVCVCAFIGARVCALMCVSRASVCSQRSQPDGFMVFERQLPLAAPRLPPWFLPRLSAASCAPRLFPVIIHGWRAPYRLLEAYPLSPIPLPASQRSGGGCSSLGPGPSSSPPATRLLCSFCCLTKHSWKRRWSGTREIGDGNRSRSTCPAFASALLKCLRAGGAWP